VPDEPGVGLEHVRMMPLEESTPVPRGAGASPGELHDSGPTPASIARVSRDSITMRSVEARGGFWCFAGSLDFSLEDLSGEGTPPLLGIQPRKSFISVKESVGDGIQLGDGGNPIRAAAAGKGSSQADEGPAKRFRPANGDEDCRSNPGTVPDRSSLNPASPSRGPHHGHDPCPDGIGQPVPDGGQLGHVRRDCVGLHEAAQSLGLVGSRSSYAPGKEGREANCFAFCFALEVAVT